MDSKIIDDMECEDSIKNIMRQNLSKPNFSLILNSVLAHEDCNESQRSNNLTFCSNIDSYIYNYIGDFLSNTTMSWEDSKECLFQKAEDSAELLKKNFTLEIGDFANVSEIFEGFCEEEIDRLSYHAYEILRTIFYRELAIFISDVGHYDLALTFHSIALLCYGGLIHDKNFDNMTIIENEISFRNQQAAKSRWTPHNKERHKKKKQYLQIMREHGFSTYADTATHIKRNVDTGKRPSYTTICRWLSEANSGNFD